MSSIDLSFMARLRWIVRLLVMAVMLLCAPVLRAAEPHVQTKAGEKAIVSVSVEPTTPSTADVVKLTIRATIDPAYDLGATTIDKALPEGWRVLDADTSPVRTDRDGKRIITRTYRLEPFLPGDVEIKPFDVLLRPLGNDARADGPVVTTDAIPLAVHSVLPKDSKPTPADIRPAVRPPFKMPAWGWAAIVGVVIAAGLIAMALVALARRQRLLKLVRLTADQRANDALDRLAVDDYLARGEIKAFHEQLSSILRTYIEDRFGLHAPDRTTEEFLSEARLSPWLTPADVVLLESFLTRCDMVKFAAVVPDRSSCDAAMDAVRAFIGRTRTDEKQLVIDPRTNEYRRAVDVPELLIAAGLMQAPSKKEGAA